MRVYESGFLNAWALVCSLYTTTFWPWCPLKGGRLRVTCRPNMCLHPAPFAALLFVFGLIKADLLNVPERPSGDCRWLVAFSRVVSRRLTVYLRWRAPGLLCPSQIKLSWESEQASCSLVRTHKWTAVLLSFRITGGGGGGWISVTPLSYYWNNHTLG